MFKSFALGKRRPGLSPQEHIAYWNGVHAAVAMRIMPPRNPGLQQYAQNHPVAVPGLVQSVDGIAETSWDSVESFEAYLAWRRTEDASELLQDEGRFADATARQRLFASRQVLFARREPGQAGNGVPSTVFKSYAMDQRRPGLDPQEYIAHWRDGHGPLAARILSRSHPGLLQYAQYHPVAVAGFAHSVDGIAETTWDSVSSFQRYLDWRDSQAAGELLQDELRFIDPARRQRLFAARHVLFDRGAPGRP